MSAIMDAAFETYRTMRTDFELYRHSRFLRAHSELRGELLNATGRDAGIDPVERIVVVTDPGSPLDGQAREAGYRVFNADPAIGGRYSALSAFGLVPSGLAGADIRETVSTNPAYAGFKAPTHLLALGFVTDEVPNSLVPLEGLGAVLGVPTPTTSARAVTTRPRPRWRSSTTGRSRSGMSLTSPAPTSATPARPARPRRSASNARPNRRTASASVCGCAATSTTVSGSNA